MRTGQDDYETSVEDAAPVDMLAALFEARGWAHEIVSADEISAEIQGSWTSYQVRAIWRADDNVLQLLCLPDIRVSDDKRRAAHELLALVNEQLWLGHFDVWSQGGMLVYRHGLAVDASGEKLYAEKVRNTKHTRLVKVDPFVVDNIRINLKSAAGIASKTYDLNVTKLDVFSVKEVTNK